MLGKCFAVICIMAVIFAGITGNISNLSNAVMDGAARAVSLTLSLLGVMCLWSGMMCLMQSAGFIAKLAKIISPVMRFAFPTAYKTGVAMDEITANVSANILGIGNAATPFAIKAMETMQNHNTDPDTATDDMVTLAVLNASSLDLLPTTLIALRRTAGSLQPYNIIVPIWISSAVCCFIAIVICRIVSACKKTAKTLREEDLRVG